MTQIMVDLVKALAWPAVALIAALAFYRPLSRLFEAIGARATKLSLFKVEVELVSSARGSGAASLDDIKNPEVAPIGDSSHMLFQQLQDTTPADYAVIDLGGGNEWLTSRLFIAAAMLERMRGVECLVFVFNGKTVQELLAVAPLRRVRWAIAQRYPWLEAAFARAYAEVLSNGGLYSPIGGTSTAQPMVRPPTGGLDPVKAAELVSRFIDLVQHPAPGGGSDWIILSHGRAERASWLNPGLLRELLPSEAFDMWAYDERHKPKAERARAVLRRRAPFVALAAADRRFIQVIDRRALLEEIVARMED